MYWYVKDTNSWEERNPLGLDYSKMETQQMRTFKRLSDTELAELLEARRAQFDQPRLLTPSEIESMKQEFQRAEAWAIEELKRRPLKKLRAHSATQLKEIMAAQKK